MLETTKLMRKIYPDKEEGANGSEEPVSRRPALDRGVGALDPAPAERATSCHHRLPTTREQRAGAQTRPRPPPGARRRPLAVPRGPRPGEEGGAGPTALRVGRSDHPAVRRRASRSAPNRR